MKTIHTVGYRALLAWLRQQRLERGLSMRDLGRCLGIAHSWIGKIETGERRLDVCEYIRLCQALECDYRDGVRRLLDAEGVCNSAGSQSPGRWHAGATAKAVPTPVLPTGARDKTAARLSRDQTMG